MKLIPKELIDDKINFIKEYVASSNAADGSKFDSNANVTTKNIATLETELNKDINIKVNRTLVTNKITEMFGEELAEEYIRQVENHEIYVHDETSIKPYCTSITMYPFLIDGMKKMGGESGPPKHLTSFCGSFVNLVFAVSAQFAGAVATVEFLIYFDHFARLEYGDDYLTTHPKEVANHLQHVVYSVNQPAAARGYQSVFWNISIYDKYYFDSMFGEFFFPDYTQPTWGSVSALQEYFLTWFNKERESSLLTFPVVTAAMLTENGETKDKEFTEMAADQLSKGSSFFIYQSESADSLASCCRLRNEISDNTFSYTLGAGGVSTGSVKVITLNMNRLEQNGADLELQIDKLHKYLVAYREVVEEYYQAGMLTVYDAGFISLNKQFLTIGINGLVEAAEFNGITISNNQEYKDFVTSKLKIIYDSNKIAKQEYGYMFNTEFVPAENLGVKNAKWDKKDGYVVPRECYNSYFYIVEDDSVNTLDKFIMHGEEMIQYLDGGSALHVNLEEATSKEGFIKLLNVSAKTGCNYFCFNVKITICNECENIDKQTLQKCAKCGSKDIDYGTRIIGYLKRVSSFSSPRQKEHKLRFYHKEGANE